MIGSHVVDALLGRGYTVVALDNLSRGRKENISPNASFVLCDICNPDALRDTFVQHGSFDFIVHQASIINEGIDSENIETDVSVNICGTLNLLELAKSFGVRRIVYASSVAVYGRGIKMPANEKQTLPEPIASYGIAKLASEHYIRYVCAQSSMSFACLRYGNIYGPRQSLNGEVGVINVFTDRVSKNLPITMYGDGSQARDFLYVKDCVEATLAAIDYKKNLIVNIAAGKVTTVSAIARTLQKVSGHEILIERKPLRYGEIGKFWCDISQAQQLLSWKPRTDLETGVRETLKWCSDLNPKS